MGVVAGERQEDLVEGRLLDGEGLDLDARLPQRDEYVDRLVAVLERDVEPTGLGGRHRLLVHEPAGQAGGGVEVGAVHELQLQGGPADGRLELVGGALGDLDAVVDDRDPVGELVGLVEVLRGQQHRAARR